MMCGDVGTGSVPVTVWGVGDGFVVAACATVPESGIIARASTNRRVSGLCIGESPFQRKVRCAETRNFGR
jgi:hypothetical protein